MEVQQAGGGVLKAVLHKATAKHQHMGPAGKKPLNMKDVKPVYEMLGPSVEEQQLMNLNAHIRLDVKIKDKHLQSANLEDLYQRAETSRRQQGSSKTAPAQPAPAAADLQAILAGTSATLTYKRVAACREVVEPVEWILQAVRTKLEVLSYMTGVGHRFELCMLLDNSGSMSGKADATKVALVVMCEVLRCLEWRFSVVRFGNKHTQRLLKGPDTLMDDTRGQLLLEAFTWSEGTYPASACGYVADTLFREKLDASQQAIHHRAVLMLVDGLTQEKAAEDYRSALEPKSTQLLVLNLQDERQAGLNSTIRSLWESCNAIYAMLPVAERDSLPRHLAQLVTTWLDGLLHKLQASSHGTLATHLSRAVREVTGHKQGMLTAPAPAPDMFCRVTQFVDQVTPQQLSDAGDLASSQVIHACSAPNAHLPLEETLQQGLAQPVTDPAGQAAAADQAAQQAAAAMDRVSDQELAWVQNRLRASPGYAATRQAALREWEAAAARVSSQILSMASVLQIVVLPTNKFTRAASALRGQSLHMPGLIKAVASDWTYRKIFAAKLKGGRREHRVVLALDVSQSMHGSKARAAMEALVVLTEALQQLDVPWALVTFGERVTLVKSEDMAWDADAAFLVLSSLVFDQQAASQDAAAVDLAVDLLSLRPKRGAKHVWVISDGCGTGGILQLARAQARAQEQGVHVVGIGLGLEPTSVPLAYQHWVTSLLPCSLPHALEQLYAAEAAGGSSPTPQVPGQGMEAHARYQALIAAASSNSETSREEVLRTHTQVFDSLVRALGGASQLKVQHCSPDSMTIDLCFVMDCTGSMTAWLEACKAQVKYIAENIIPKIQKDYEGLEIHIRYGLVAYRDVGDAQALHTMDFTADVATLVQEVRQLVATGGGDTPEDILPALQAASQLSWQSKARFAVLIADAPCHGRDCNDEPDDAYPQGSPSGITVQQAMQDLRRQDIDLMLGKVRKGVLDKMEAQFAMHYNDKENNRLLKSTILFDDSRIAATRFHLVFVLDESGSMCGQPWRDLCSAYNQMLARRCNDQSQGDLISIVTFDSSPTVHQSLAQLAGRPAIPACNRGGGTNFEPALRSAEQLLAQTPAGYTPMILFMSDGCDGGGDPITVMRRIRANHLHSNLQVHTIAFGGYNVARLQQLAAEGGGQYHQCQSGVDLATAFVNIAKGCTAVDGLVQRFGEILSDAISLKVLVDYL